MRELNECLWLCREMQKINEQIDELKARVTSPKNQIITDMPKGGGKQINTLDDYLIKVDKLKKFKAVLKKKQGANWKKAKHIFFQCGIDQKKVELMQLRFVCGLPWKRCAVVMSDRYTKEWNINKCFRVYREVLNKVNKRNF